MSKMSQAVHLGSGLTPDKQIVLLIEPKFNRCHVLGIVSDFAKIVNTASDLFAPVAGSLVDVEGKIGPRASWGGLYRQTDGG